MDSARTPFAAELKDGIELGIVLADDDNSVLDHGGRVRLLEWDAWGAGGFKEVAAWFGSSPDQEKEDPKNVRGSWMLGGSMSSDCKYLRSARWRKVQCILLSLPRRMSRVNLYH